MPPATIQAVETPAPPPQAQSPQAVQDAPKMRTIQIPHSRTGWALLQAEFPMTEASWDQMLAVLTAMKPSLVDSGD